MKIFITGGSGFIGSHLVEKLLADGNNEVMVVARSLKPVHLTHLLSHARLTILRMDFLEGINFEAVLKDVDIVYHLLWNSLPRKESLFIQNDLRNTVAESLRMLDGCVHNGVKKVIFASSGGTVYGKTSVEKIDESHATNPISSYGVTKLMFEKYLHLYYHEHKLEYSILRIANAYGERQNLKVAQGVVSHWIWRALHQESIEIWGDGETVRDYIYIDDVIDAFLKVGIPGEQPFSLYNIGSGDGVLLNRLTELIIKNTGIGLNIVYKKGYKTDAPRNVLDISRANQALSWYPQVQLGEGIIRT
ncbi:MAG: NAD-dependent epimerase/dehydratase family protein [Bacteroidia bacterium]